MRKIQKNEVVSGCGFHHVAVQTSEWEKSTKFWREGMGFHLALEWGEAPERACLLDTGDGNYLELFERPPLENKDADSPILHFCFRTDDVDAATERARAAGAEVTVEPKEPAVFSERGHKVRLSFIKGPGGELCEFFQSDTL